MGNPNSKIENAKKISKPDEGSVPSTPILTPKAKLLDNDPRSPSTNIARTPIHSVMDVNKPGTPIVGVINSEDQDNSVVNIDPRSPTVEFTRTPIVVENQPIKLRNKNLDNVRQQLMNFSPAKQAGESLNTSIKAPKLIGVSPIIKKVEQTERRRSYVGLLETDLDFVETDIDKVTKLNNTLPNIENEKEIFELEKSTASSLPSQISEETDEHTEIDEETNEYIEGDGEISEHSEVDEEPKEKISKTEIVQEESPQNSTPENIVETEPLLSKEDIISPIKETLERISQIDKEIKEVIATSHSPTINNDYEIESKEFDKKVTNLIYEDEEIINSIPKTIKLKNENRTPLSERNVNHHDSKKTKLKVHDRPQKKDYAVSKIPVFRERKGKSKIAVQCENTPPRQMTDLKQRKSQWDADKTLII